MATPHKWEFAPRFRRHAFGWKSDMPIQRIKEALAEIKATARKDPVLAAEGAVLFLEKLAPAIAHVDSSSGRLGSAVHHAIETLVPVIATAPAGRGLHAKWLERLWQAFLVDDMPYLESLGERWGDVCATPDVASAWADRLLPALRAMWAHCASTGEYGYAREMDACLGALYAAGRDDELLALIGQSEYRHASWSYRIWGARALARAGRYEDAIRYAQETNDMYATGESIAAFCEGVLLERGFADEAYARYAIAATSAATNLATFKALAKKYPGKSRETILRDLVASQPGKEGKWFAAAKDAGLFDLAIDLANRSPSDPHTLIRAAREQADKRPDFALAAGMTALRGIASGWGYDIGGADVLDAWAAVTAAAQAAGADMDRIRADVRALVHGQGGGDFVAKVLGRQLLD